MSETIKVHHFAHEAFCLLHEPPCKTCTTVAARIERKRIVMMLMDEARATTGEIRRAYQRAAKLVLDA